MNGQSSTANPTPGEGTDSLSCTTNIKTNAFLAVLRSSKFELGVSLTLSAWPALTLAVQNQWGGPDSADKRDWFAGAICDLFPTHAELEDVEDRLLQIMDDEFEVAPDDDSVSHVADRIMLVWEETSKGDFGTVDRMFEEWRSRKGNVVKAVQMGEDDDGESVDEESDEDDEDEDDEDIEMSDASEPVLVKEKKAPEVDEDGFTKVPARRKR
jgi:pre-rRNA-processing protein TSR2